MPKITYFFTDVVIKSHTRYYPQEMAEAKKGKVSILLERGSFEVVEIDEILIHANVLARGFLLTIKTIDGIVKHRTHIVVSGDRESMKYLIVHYSQTLQPSKIRLILAMAATHSFTVWTSDVLQTYLQS